MRFGRCGPARSWSFEELEIGNQSKNRVARVRETVFLKVSTMECWQFQDWAACSMAIFVHTLDVIVRQDVSGAE
jgi:hypothetical protein